MVDFDHLITKDKLDENDNFEDFITPETEFHTKGFADLNVGKLKAGDIIQFERKGYFRVDKPLKKVSLLFYILSQMVKQFLDMVPKINHKNVSL